MATCAGFAFLVPMGSTNSKVDEIYRVADLVSGTNEDFIAKIAKLPLEAQPGTLFRYGLQQKVRGVIVQRISGQSLGAFLERRIFGPLGMTDNGFGVAVEERDRIAPRYALDVNLKLRLADDQRLDPFRCLATPHSHDLELDIVIGSTTASAVSVWLRPEPRIHPVQRSETARSAAAILISEFNSIRAETVRYFEAVLRGMDCDEIWRRRTTVE